MEKQNCREVYGRTLAEMGGQDERIVALEADLGRSTQSWLFRDAFPHRHFEMGIAEDNMVSTAAGLALSGKIPLRPFVLRLRHGAFLRPDPHQRLPWEPERPHRRLKLRTVRPRRRRDAPKRRRLRADASAAEHDHPRPGLTGSRPLRRYAPPWATKAPSTSASTAIPSPL